MDFESSERIRLNENVINLLAKRISLDFKSASQGLDTFNAMKDAGRLALGDLYQTTGYRIPFDHKNEFTFDGVVYTSYGSIYKVMEDVEATVASMFRSGTPEEDAARIRREYAPLADLAPIVDSSITADWWAEAPVAVIDDAAILGLADRIRRDCDVKHAVELLTVRPELSIDGPSYPDGSERAFTGGYACEGCKKAMIYHPRDATKQGDRVCPGCYASSFMCDCQASDDDEDEFTSGFDQCTGTGDADCNCKRCMVLRNHD